MAVKIARAGDGGPGVVGVAQEHQGFAGGLRFTAEGGANGEADFHATGRHAIHLDVHHNAGPGVAQGELGPVGQRVGIHRPHCYCGHDSRLRVAKENYYAIRCAV